MRDILVTLLVFGSLPLIFKKPHWGAVMWIWISVMNLHSQGWGFARTFPFAAIIAATMVLSILTSKEKHRLPMTPVTVVFILFILWMGVTSLFAINFDHISTQLIKVYKITGMTLVVLMLVTCRKHIDMVMWTIVVSIGYYGVKGGIFTIRSGGNDRVWGPEGTFIGGNNEVALALVMVIPLMFYLHSISSSKWIKRALLASIFLCALAALGSYSRGAALAIGAMAGFLWLKSSKKLMVGAMMVCSVPLLLMLMPPQWFERIETINTYEEDTSAMGRINAWRMAYNLANDRPLVGGGFEIYDAFVFATYAPIPEDIHAAHSIYFQILGEHGWVGLALYLALGFVTWRCGSWVIARAKRRPDLKWASDLVTMVQVSLLGFAVGGAFLSLAYFDVPYYLMVVMIVTRLVVERELKIGPPVSVTPVAPDPKGRPVLNKIP